jgi:hypothetical protein
LRGEFYSDRLERVKNQKFLFGFPKKGDEVVNPETDEKEWLKGIKKKIEEEMAEKEIETILYWKAEMEKILAKRPESLGTFQIEMKNFIQRMQNRIKVLKNSLPK